MSLNEKLFSFFSLNQLTSYFVPMSAMGWDWKQFLSSTSDNELDAIRKHERTGRPLGGDNFLSLLEEKIGRIKKKQKPGPKKNDN